MVRVTRVVQANFIVRRDKEKPELGRDENCTTARHRSQNGLAAVPALTTFPSPATGKQGNTETALQGDRDPRSESNRVPSALHRTRGVALTDGGAGSLCAHNSGGGALEMCWPGCRIGWGCSCFQACALAVCEGWQRAVAGIAQRLGTKRNRRARIRRNRGQGDTRTGCRDLD